MTIFTDNITNIHGEIGREWLNNLDTIVSDLAERWNLTNLKPFENLTFNYVLSGFQNDVPIVLKVGIRDGKLKQEARALKFFENHGAVKLMESSEGAILLQRTIPGNSLVEYFPNKENESIEIAANIIQKLHSVNHIADRFFHIKDLLNILHENWEIPEHYINKAKRIAEYLQKTTERQVVMHRDLHHDNIVQDGNGWKIIDPDGVIGDPIYEIASFMINPIDKIWKDENAISIIKNRIHKFSRLLNVYHNRIAQWAFVKSVLCWIWTLEDFRSRQDRSQLAILFDGIVMDLK